MPALFITGTDTGVGKSVVTAGLASVARTRKLDIAVYKPIQTGCPTDRPEDPAQIQSWVHPDLPVYNTYCFEAPATPWIADTHGQIHPQQIQNDFARIQTHHDWVLVEGAGGVRVPITARYEMIDLMRDLNLPVLVVTRPELGTINHTLLTVEALRYHRIPVTGVVISGYPDNTQDIAIQTLTQVFQRYLIAPLLGTLSQLTPPYTAERLAPVFTPLFEQLTQKAILR